MRPDQGRFRLLFSEALKPGSAIVAYALVVEYAQPDVRANLGCGTARRAQ
jgi:hypothetical protein